MTAKKPPASRVVPQATRLTKHFAKHPGDRCPYMFPEHQSHAAQQCTRLSGHLGHHHCAGVKK
jgi:hypothetical protein